MFAVSHLSRFLYCSVHSHWNVAKKILKYLKEIINYRLCYSFNPNTNDLVGYSDSNFANDVETRRSVFLKLELELGQFNGSKL